MKAIDINDSIKTYSSIPKSWGSIVAGFDLLSDSELETHGFYNIEYPSDYDSQIHNFLFQNEQDLESVGFRT